jgi:branched-chain amino acid transport system ATP-binding protein
MEVLRVDGLSKNFGGLQVFHGLSFTVEAGDKLALIGPNGAGKTTLLNILGGQLPATTGRVHLLGKEITRLAPRHRLHLGLSRSFQLNNLFFNLTLMENILLALEGAERSHFQMLHPIDAQTELVATAQELLESMGLWEKRFDPITTLSYGDQRRMDFALAMVSKPKLLLLDEPSAGLTIAESVALADTMRQLPKDTALFFCAHDMDLVFNLADQIMVLGSGQIIARGAPHEIQANPKVKEIYLGSEEISEDVRSS